MQTLDVARGESWLEIGPGHGEMTELAGAGWGATWWRLRRMNGLRRDCASMRRPGGEVEIVSGDVLQVDLRSLAGEGVRVYGNLPYYITSPILRRLVFGGRFAFDSIHIVIQLEVAERIVARPGRRAYGYLSALCQFYARPEIELRIPAGAFRPPPEVNSALVGMALPGERASLAIADEATVSWISCRFVLGRRGRLCGIICVGWRRQGGLRRRLQSADLLRRRGRRK